MTRLAALALSLAVPAALAQQKTGDWQSLFDGKSLQGWREAAFQGKGKVRIEDNAIMLGAGAPMTGVNWSGAFPKTNYEVRFEAARLQGNDFFASLTFPVGDAFLTLVTGGWGGDIVGISSIDGWDASDNETRSYVTFENGKWYAFRLRVTPDRIMVWIDEKQIVNVVITGRALSLRHGDIKLSVPFGFAAYNTAGGIRKIEYRTLP
jgi:hypothetical protein